MKQNFMKAALIAEARQAAERSSFVRGSYSVLLTVGLDEYASTYDRRYKNIDTTVPAKVFAVILDSGKPFFKVLFTTTDGEEMEMKLSKESNLEEDDLIDVSTIKFSFIKKSKKSEWVCDGKLYEEPKPESKKRTRKSK